MKIVVRDRRFNRSGRKGWNMVLQLSTFDYKEIQPFLEIPKDLLLKWQAEKSPLGYCSFRTLKPSQILQILALVKGELALVNVNRWGEIAYFKLQPDKVVLQGR